MSHSEPFTPRQRGLIDSLASPPYPTLTDAAASCGIPYGTAKRWNETPAFSAAIDGARGARKSESAAALDAEVHDAGREAFEVALSIMRDGSALPQVRLSAATYVVDRVMGKPKQTQEVSGRNGEPIEHAHRFDLTGFTDDELRDIVSRATAPDEHGAPTPEPA